MAINWNTIRPLQTSRNDGFEELVCQLARKEKISGQKFFTRIGRPDAGKECLWELYNGEQHMWQAKYFTTVPSTGQWGQIEESVIKAIDNHPQLVRYYISLPIDRPDAKLKGQKSMLQKWNEKVASWQQYASGKGMSVEFEYWGHSELVARLTLPENEGLQFFWFNEDEFTARWYEHRNSESITALGARYTKELNVQLPIAKLFDGITKSSRFQEQAHALYDNLLGDYRGLPLNPADAEIIRLQLELQQHITHYRAFFEEINLTDNSVIPVSHLLYLLNAVQSIVSAMDERLRTLRRALEEEKGKISSYDRPFGSELSYLSRFTQSLYQVKSFWKSTTCALANHPFLLITGDAGMGKSHLLADVISKREREGKKSLLLLGENFTTREMPWRQILSNQLQVGCRNELVFLEALNSQAESENSRTILFIDALNEGEGRHIWPSRLKFFINTVKQFSWLGLVITVRTSYESLLAPPETLDESVILRHEHVGFKGHEYEATKLFFSHYKIQQPGSPLLHPEFGNPLFLKLFCIGLRNKGQHQVPEGYEGITTVFNYFIESVDYKLAHPNELYYEERKRLVGKSVSAVVQRMIDTETEWIPYEEADEITGKLFTLVCAKVEPYLQRLISEGVFNKDITRDDTGNSQEIIMLAYQRFQDHMVVENLIDRYLNQQNLVESFGASPLAKTLLDESTCFYHQNIVEALAIQLPEKFGKEIFEMVPHAKNFSGVADAFIQSLIWRRAQTFGPAALQFVSENIDADELLYEQFRDTILMAGMKLQFPFNADYLHQQLLPLSLAQRDVSWTVWLQDQYGYENQSSAVARLIDWAWDETDHSHVSNESLLLACTLLAWFFASSNRILRDSATKALVSLLQHRMQLIVPLLSKFRTVNDPYVLDRLYAAAYGSVLRTAQTHLLQAVSSYVYTAMFDKKLVYPHVLLRDYARGIIEYAIHKGVVKDIDVTKIRPPYKSKSIPKRLPSNDIIDRKYEPTEITDNWGAHGIIRSMTTEYGRGTGGYGNFGRYIFQYGFDDWPVRPDLLSNYAIQRIWEMGYSPALFSEFDSHQPSGAKERIGKKYQWIAFHELLARVADQYRYGESGIEGDKTGNWFSGPWEMHVRNIDPTILVKKTGAERNRRKHTRHWWSNIEYAPWKQSHEEWVADKTNLPDPQKIIEVADKNGEQWLCLEIHPEWGEPKRLGEEIYRHPEKRLWYQIRSYLVRKKDLSKFEKSFAGNIQRRDLPEAPRSGHVFDREYYWAPAFFQDIDLPQEGNYFQEIYHRATGRWIGELCLTTEEFSWSEESDYSKEDSISFYKPAEVIFDGLHLQPAAREGSFTDSNGQIICFDPSVTHKSLSGLFIRKSEFLQWLEKEEYAIFWTVIGEKQVLGDHREEGKYYGRLNISGLYKSEGETLTGNLRFEKE